MADEPIPVVRLVPGLVVTEGTGLAVNVGGTTPPVWWPAGYIPTAGDAVKVLMVDGTAVVHSPVITTQRPLTGVVTGTAANGVVNVTTSAGVLACRYVGTPPANGTTVRLDWQSTTPWVWTGGTSTTPPPGPGPGGGGPTPPPVVVTGQVSAVAVDSATWNGNNWSPTMGTAVVQGSYGGYTYSGAWFYGSAPQQAAGRIVTRAQIRLGARRRMGNYNAAMTLNLYRTANPTRPGGDVTRVQGPHAIVQPPGAPARWVDIPVAYMQAIVDNGGGLGIAGGDYGGVEGIGDDPASGQIFIDWRSA